ncbi:uncharacterized protein VDAG_03442 [Verticillium dahliae VdLs.17]|uniref:Uncharacterized protein n=1 Tax=Verticillium dahliae (strain VdLs.17 / ATCC MYA-4575 / FGSC 10137) TaxID=498257 RepID=G2WZK0_VERDV|nr:uncharacterized protein VDAG_03442 [Verticillium dahliae VdLs.17]EGY22002.1 hypothetical protein VDAG_03442 [Verticillium dahliae VdLs.17]
MPFEPLPAVPNPPPVVTSGFELRARRYCSVMSMSAATSGWLSSAGAALSRPAITVARGRAGKLPWPQQRKGPSSASLDACKPSLLHPLCYSCAEWCDERATGLLPRLAVVPTAIDSEKAMG